MNPQEFYTAHSIMTDPAEYGSLFNALPDDIPALCSIVQGLIIHMQYAEHYGVTLSEERRENESNLRKVSRQLRRIMELNDALLSAARPPESKLVGNCRDFSVFLTAILRHKGVPTRVRCGFSTYFPPDMYINHWVCQYWNTDEKRWVWVDAQIDDFQRNAYGIDFDISDMPEGLFLPAGDCWKTCRTGKANPELFRYFLDWRGMPFILGNLVRDLLSLNEIELLPWDKWSIMPEDEHQGIPAEDMELMDRTAAVTQGTNPKLSEVRSIYENEERLHLPVFLEQYLAGI